MMRIKSLLYHVGELIKTIINYIVFRVSGHTITWEDEPAPYINNVDETDVDTPVDWSKLEAEEDEEFLGI